MKRIISMLLFLTVLASLSFSSCNIAEPIDLYKEVEKTSESSAENQFVPGDESTDESQTLPEEFETLPEGFETLPDESEDTSNESEIPTQSGQSAESDSWVAPYLMTKDYDEYMNYVNEMRREKKLSDAFISYDIISGIGDFYIFRTWYEHDRRYDYWLYDENEVIIHISVEPLKDQDSTVNMIISNDRYNANNLRNVRSFANGVRHALTFDNITYHYYENGKLYQATWAVNGKLFSIAAGTGYERMSDYPLDGEETFVSRLLSKYTAIAAVQSLNQKIEAYTAKNIADSKAK